MDLQGYPGIGGLPEPFRFPSGLSGVFDKVIDAFSGWLLYPSVLSNRHAFSPQLRGADACLSTEYGGGPAVLRLGR